MKYLRWFAVDTPAADVRYLQELRHHHRRYKRYVANHGIPCTECDGAEGEYCHLCEGTGLMPPNQAAQRMHAERMGA